MPLCVLVWRARVRLHVCSLFVCWCGMFVCWCAVHVCGVHVPSVSLQTMHAPLFLYSCHPPCKPCQTFSVRTRARSLQTSGLPYLSQHTEWHEPRRRRFPPSVVRPRPSTDLCVCVCVCARARVRVRVRANVCRKREREREKRERR